METNKFQELTDRIDRKDREHNNVWDAWDLINGLVNEIYGIDIGEALDAWEAQSKNN